MFVSFLIQCFLVASVTVRNTIFIIMHLSFKCKQKQRISALSKTSEYLTILCITIGYLAFHISFRNKLEKNSLNTYLLKYKISQQSSTKVTIKK